jgi:hypothetical protein
VIFYYLARHDAVETFLKLSLLTSQQQQLLLLNTNSRYIGGNGTTDFCDFTDFHNLCSAYDAKRL